MESISIDFLNSDWRDWRGTGNHENRLTNKEWLTAYLEKWQLHDVPPPSEAVLAQLNALRERMRSIVEAICAEKALAEDDLDALNQHMQPLSAFPQLRTDTNGYRLEQITSVKGWSLVMARIAVDLAELISSENVRRLKICDNIDCQWVFYDESRNRVRRWCDDKCCGNLMKVRRFRERQRGK